MEAEVTEIIEESWHESSAFGPKLRAGELEVRAELTVGADGRHSVVRERAGLSVLNLGAPMDVLWMRMRRQPTDPGQTFGRFDSGRILVFLNREEYWQMAYVIPKGKADELRQQGLPAFRQELIRLAPFLHDRVDELRDWDDIKLLTVAVDRLSQWSRPGLLCIGDAAHAMSPIGGVGINLAIQDAVATANILGERLRQGTVNLRRPRGRTATKNISHPRYPAHATVSAEQRDPKGTEQHQATRASLAGKAFRALGIFAANPGARARSGISSGAREDARSAGCLILFCRVRPSLSDHDRVLHLAEQLSNGGRGMGHENCVALALSADVLQGVEILGDQDEHHDVLGRGPFNSCGECFHRYLESFDNRLALICNALALQGLALGFRLRLLYLEYFLRFAPSAGGYLFTLRRVDLIHRALYFFVRLDVGDQGLVDGVSVGGHHVVEAVLDCHRPDRIAAERRRPGSSWGRGRGLR